MSGAIPQLPNTPSWSGVQLKHRNNFTLLLPFAYYLDGNINTTPAVTISTK
jgi:hypothetical protein